MSDTFLYKFYKSTVTFFKHWHTLTDQRQHWAVSTWQVLTT